MSDYFKNRKVFWLGVGVAGLVVAGGLTSWLVLSRRPSHHKKTPPSALPSDAADAIHSFLEAVEWIRILGESIGLSDAQRLHLYALYKQGTLGRCDTPQPGLLDAIARAKWNSWTELGDMPSDAAQQQYLAEVQRLQGELLQGTLAKSPASSSSSGMHSGPVFSRPVLEYEAAEGVDPSAPMHPLIEAISSQDATAESVADALRACGDAEAVGKVRDSNGWTPLHWAADRGNAEVVAAVLEAGAGDVDAVDEEGESALHVAVTGEDPEIVTLLCRSGASVRLESKEGVTPLDMAEDSPEILEILNQFI